MDEPIIRVAGVHKTYDTGTVTVHALQGIDLSIRRGEMVAVMGPLRLRQDHAAQHLVRDR